MNRREREVLKAHLAREAKLLADMERRYRTALTDVRKELKKLAGRERSTSVLRQMDLQTAIAQDLTGITRRLEQNTYSTMEEFLKDSYETGWNGSFYSMDGQGVNLNLPVPQNVINIVTDTSGGIPLSSRLHSSIEGTRLKIADELTRGISQGRGYDEISRNLANVTGLGWRDAQRIGRTEGHRVYQRATFDAQRRAKGEGADVQKQWDSTLDGKVRPAHREAHGQLRDIEEPFDVGGEELDYPGGNGSARNVINCRCTSLQRASWALDRPRVSEYNTGSFEDYKISVNL